MTLPMAPGTEHETSPVARGAWYGTVEPSPAGSKQMLLPVCDGFELLPVATALEQMPIARGAGDGSGAFARGVRAADVA